MSMVGRLKSMLHIAPKVETSVAQVTRAVVTHVVILDGTLSSLEPGQQTNAGITYELCREMGGEAHMSVRYEAGIQWRGWRHVMDVVEGRGINRQIRRVYGALASRYKPGDRIFIFGYSRGAYAARSLAGMIDQLGLLQASEATERNVSVLYTHYQNDPQSAVAQGFSRSHCHQNVEIEMIGLWDTVAAIGLRFPLLWRLSKAKHRFHSLFLGAHVKRGYHALAYHENRRAYTPVLWRTADAPYVKGQEVVQMWFRGNHGDVGGQLGGWEEGRKLSNAALVWMLDKAETAGLALRKGWRSRYLADPTGPKSPPWRGWAKLFWARKARLVGRDPSEVLHPSLTQGVRRRRSIGAVLRLMRLRLLRLMRGRATRVGVQRPRPAPSKKSSEESSRARASAGGAGIHLRR